MIRSNNLIYSLILSLIILFTTLSFASALAGTNSPSSDVGSKAAALSSEVDKDGGFCEYCLEETSDEII